MTKSILQLTILCFPFYIFAQGNGSFGVQSSQLSTYVDSRLNHEIVKTMDREKTNNLKTIGSPYLNEEFWKVELNDSKKKLKEVYVKYHAQADQFVFKMTQLEEEEPQGLVKATDVWLKSEEFEEIKRLNYLDKKGDTELAYLFSIYLDDNFSLYKRFEKEFKEGRESANSMVSDVPNSFREEFFYLVKREDKLPQYIKFTKRGIREFFGRKKAKDILDYIKTQHLDLDKTEDLRKLFVFLN